VLNSLTNLWINANVEHMLPKEGYKQGRATSNTAD
jgi:hypothetical protein